ncbi:hypothetical protein DACRYDRAFT_103351 [Dacryopinax primogenitus]|uniref:Arginyl-tRNA--protein transferase 1 n=1 Tax=Dacryopinax primogenitus (strain DJM 731) TaxID=1858805 RepID=M5G864_DACPD|nr:uncharacterized protein DACRYDRAFT_103351 [Dacryopinax primogenitus]EJU06406.1 hypothetical protein DACRYDRAFT_103351 [Dacryopinax primogenitus]
MTPLSLVSFSSGLSQHTCGYCSPSGERSLLPTSISYGLNPRQLSVSVYQRMLDRGWRRSGTYAYKPDMGRTCCPQYTIKLDALGMKAGKSQKGVVKAWNKFVVEGEKEVVGDGTMQVDVKPVKKKGRDNAPFDLPKAIHASEMSYLPEESTPAHEFEVVLELSSYSEEKFELYVNYQAHAHKEEDKAPSSFKRFLCHSPLIPEDISYPRPPPPGLPKKYGSYHQKYILDGKLIALGVIDILPNCVSSVYFMYSSKVEKWGMGKISALREAMLVREMHEAGLEDLKYLYMGYYIHSCQKMRYKGDYSPSYLLDPEDYTWHSLPTCVPLLDAHQYVSFSHPPEGGQSEADVQGPIDTGLEEMEALEMDGMYDPLPRLMAGCEDPLAVAQDPKMRQVNIVNRQERNTVSVRSVVRSKIWKIPMLRRMVCDAVAALGWELALEVVFAL